MVGSFFIAKTSPAAVIVTLRNFFHELTKLAVTGSKMVQGTQIFFVAVHH